MSQQLLAVQPRVATETKICDQCFNPALVLVVRRNSHLCPSCLSRFPICARELENRQRVALKLVAVIESCGGDPNGLRTMTEADWELAARSAGVEKPSLETRSVVAGMLSASREVARG